MQFWFVRERRWIGYGWGVSNLYWCMLLSEVYFMRATCRWQWQPQQAHGQLVVCFALQCILTFDYTIQCLFTVTHSDPIHPNRKKAHVNHMEASSFFSIASNWCADTTQSEQRTTTSSTSQSPGHDMRHIIPTDSIKICCFTWLFLHLGARVLWIVR